MTCKHIETFFAHKTNLTAYKTILTHLTFPQSKKGFVHKSSISCPECQLNSAPVSQDMLVGRSTPCCILACAHCIHFTCSNQQHLASHRKNLHDHILYVCLERGELYCAGCTDYVYHPVAEKLLQLAHTLYLAQFGLSSQFWRPSFEELKLLPHITSVIPLSTNSGTRPTRGLINMGSTCFLNVVVQALTHTPVLRDYLLADLHRCTNPARSRSCLACEMVRITQEIYSPVRTPFVPNNLLYAIWSHASHLAGYEQQDAHEFLITLLTLIHGHLIGEHIPLRDTISDPDIPLKRRLKMTSRTRLDRISDCPILDESSLDGVTALKPSSCRALDPDSTSSQTSSASSSRESGEACDCIVHQVFFGNLESVISYEGCGHNSSTVDPFLDLSLDVIQRGSTSLEACLISYFRPEIIDGLILCSQCNIGRPAVKQFSLLHLPNVLCFYLKRCHHDTKINTSITFPADLDLAPYLNQINGDKSAWQDRYSLYAVLNHSGQANSGHYIAYIRFAPGSWCLCDDQKIIPVSLEHVLQTDAYVLFYHKNLLAMRT